MKQKYLALLFIIILTAILFFYISSKTIAKKIDLIESYDEEIKKKQEQLNSAKVLNEQLKEVSKVIMNSMTQEKHFSSEEVNDFVKQIANLADRYKIPIHAISPKFVDSGSRSLVEHQYGFMLNCTYVQLGQFLTELESFDQIIKITNLDVSPISTDKSDSNIETRYRVGIELSTYKIIKEA